MSRLLTIPEVAPVLRLSTRRAYELAQAGQLAGVRRRGTRQYRVSVAELEAYLGAPLAPVGSAS